MPVFYKQLAAHTLEQCLDGGSTESEEYNAGSLGGQGSNGLLEAVHVLRLVTIQLYEM